MDENIEYYYNPDAVKDKDLSKIIDEELEITLGEFNEALRDLADKHGKNGPFTAEEVGEAITEVIVNSAFKSLTEKRSSRKSYVSRWST